jgi:hypothetical protein
MRRRQIRRGHRSGLLPLVIGAWQQAVLWLPSLARAPGALPVKVCLAIPAYRQSINAATALAWMQDALTARDLGWTPIPFFVDCSGIARSRNRIVDAATGAGARLLLMCDSDSYPDVPEGGLAHMWQAMQDHDAAIVSAAFVVRNGTRVNCEPSRPGEIYEGEGGTAYMLVDLWKLRDLPRPWFVHRDSTDGLTVECGEDIYFCRHAKANGHRVVINYALPTAHVDQSASRTFA